MFARSLVLTLSLCSVADAALIKDRDNDLALGTDFINVHVDEFGPQGHPTTWFARDGAKSPYAFDNDNVSLGPPFGQTTGRSSFWVPRSQPTFYLWGISPPAGEIDFGGRGLTFHTIDVEALAGANVVTVDPSNVPGQFAYSWTGGSRSVTLPVLPVTPEPSSAVLCLIGLAFVAKRWH